MYLYFLAQNFRKSCNFIWDVSVAAIYLKPRAKQTWLSLSPLALEFSSAHDFDPPKASVAHGCRLRVRAVAVRMAKAPLQRVVFGQRNRREKVSQSRSGRRKQRHKAMYLYLRATPIPQYLAKKCRPSRCCALTQPAFMGVRPRPRAPSYAVYSRAPAPSMTCHTYYSTYYIYTVSPMI